MGYSVKWIDKNLGITRDMLRYYEKKGLLPTESTRNSANNYRDYSDKDIQRIWGIRLLIKIGFSPEEIQSFMKNPEFDFDTAIAQKVEDLERTHDENVICLEFAKSIKLLGRVPTVSKIGSVRFDEFLKYAHENWNFYDDPRSAPFMKASDLLISKPPQEWSSGDLERLGELIESLDIEGMMHACTLHSYYQVIADMRDLGHASIPVQRTVQLLHNYMVQHNTEPELEGKITPQFIAKYTAPFFVGGDVAVHHERNYGRDGCLFIAQALAYYGGYNIEDL